MFSQDSGRIIGRMIDDDGTLPGVTILVLETSQGTTSNLDGTFNLGNLSSGTYTLQANFIGYQSLERSVTIKEGSILDLGDLALTTSIVELADVVVKASYLPSQIRAYNIQKSAPNIQNVIAADGIGKLPDRNAAEAVQRIPGVSIQRDQGEGRFALVRGTPSEWNSNLVNGDRLPSTDGFEGSRQIALDVIPSELIEYAIVSKALTPDMEGDAIGGSINFKTRSAPQEQLLNVSVAGGYNAQIQEPNYNASLIYGDRIGKFGFLVSTAVWNRPWASDNYELEYNFDLPGSQSFSINNQQLRDYEGERNTVGLNLAMDLQLNKDSKIFARGLYDIFSDNEYTIEHIYNFPEGPGVEPEDIGVGVGEIRIREANFRTVLAGGELGGEHRLNNKLKLDWKASAYDVQVEFGNGFDTQLDGSSGIHLATFQQPGVTFNNVSEDNFVYWGFDSPNGIGSRGDAFQPGINEPFAPEGMFNFLSGLFIGDSDERDLVGQFNFEYDANSDLTFKFGGKYRNKEKTSVNRQDFYIPLGLFGAPIPLTFLDELASEDYDTKGGFLQEFGEPYNDLLLDVVPTEAGLSDLIANTYANTDQFFPAAAFPIELVSYDGSENVAAVYGMADLKLSNELSILAGLRYEHTSVDLNGNNQDTAGVITSLNVTSDYGSLLPALHLKFTPEENFNLRAAVTRSMARPSFVDLNPNATVSSLGGGFTQIDRGNPNLEPTYSWNFDLLGEYYFKDVGIISGGVFYKALSNLIFSNLSQETIGGETVRITEPRNLQSASLFGFEIAFSKRFTSLPGILGGFGVDLNYTFTESTVDVPTFDPASLEEMTTEQTLIGQPSNIFNAAIFYERNGLTLRVAANYNGEYIDEYRVEAGPDHYRFYDRNLTVDGSASYAFSDKLRLFAEVNNLTNEPLRYFHGIRERPEQVEFYSIRGQLGIRFSLR
ncbi:MAG: TonB-dependent receptor [Bacteroidota bacterium]